MKNLGFPRSRWLAKQHEFKRVYETGRKTSNEYLTVYTCPVQGRQGKVGIVAGRRLGNAVERNRTRRILRETIRTNQHSITDNTDLVVIVKGRALDLPHQELAEQFVQLLRKSEAF